MTPARHILIRGAPDGAIDVYSCRRRTHLHRAPDKTAAVAWAAALLGLRVTIAVPRRGRLRPRRIFALARLAGAGLHARRGIPARHVGVRFLPLPRSRILRPSTRTSGRSCTPTRTARTCRPRISWSASNARRWHSGCSSTRGPVTRRNRPTETSGGSATRASSGAGTPRNSSTSTTIHLHRPTSSKADPVPAATPGERIRALFRDADDAVIVAPFMKVDALESLLDTIPAHVPLRCVTRWLPREVAAGVSDPEVLAVLRERGNAAVSLVDRLHAKLYIADEKCLTGSANVTFAGFGESASSGNIEVLVETTTANHDVAATLHSIDQEAIVATQAMATAVRRLAESIAPPAMLPDFPRENAWYPVSRRPEDAFRMYTTPPTGFIKAADRLLLADVANCNLLPCLAESRFRQRIRALLFAVPMSKPVLDATEDFLFTRHAADRLIETMATEAYSATDIWTSFVRWMAYFFSDKVTVQEVSELALRRAQDV